MQCMYVAPDLVTPLVSTGQCRAAEQQACADAHQAEEDATNELEEACTLPKDLKTQSPKS